MLHISQESHCYFLYLLLFSSALLRPRFSPHLLHKGWAGRLVYPISTLVSISFSTFGLFYSLLEHSCLLCLQVDGPGQE